MTGLALNPTEVALLAKIAAACHDNDMLDEGTHPLALDLARRCSEAMARGEVLAVVSPPTLERAITATAETLGPRDVLVVRMEVDDPEAFRAAVPEHLRGRVVAVAPDVDYEIARSADGTVDVLDITVNQHLPPGTAIITDANGDHHRITGLGE